MNKIKNIEISPVPWHVGKTNITVYDKYGRNVAMVQTTSMDANVIVAAPELRQAVYELLGIVRNRLPKQPTIDEIEAVRYAEKALAKAVGEVTE